MSSGIGYVIDRDTKKNLNCKGLNYWDAYIEEILDELGYEADRIYLKDLPEQIGKYEHIFIMNSLIEDNLKRSLDEWVKQGGVLIGIRSQGADDLFGISNEGILKQADDEFTINGYIKLNDKGKEYIPDRKAVIFNLPCISEITRVKSTDSYSLGEMLEPVSGNIQGGSSRFAAITMKEYGKGKLMYFSYNLCQTIWVIHQGRPVDRDWDGDGMYRSGDGIALTSAHDLSLTYADFHLRIIRSLLDESGIPFKFPLPPSGGKITDLLLHYGGDDEADFSGVQKIATARMKEKGLPYHFNIMPTWDMKGFAVDKELFKEIKENGHECSLHFNFRKIREFYSMEELYEQLDLYEKVYNETPVATVNHCLMFTGWTQQARWASQRGIKGDAGRSHTRLMPDSNPINVFGTAFGTTYPHFVFDDGEHSNVKLPYVYIPICFYEPRVREGHIEDVKRLEKALEEAVENAYTMGMFYHPVYIARDKECLGAIDATLEYIEKKDLTAKHMGTDELCLWWFDRSDSKITVKEKNQKNMVLEVDAKNKNGIIVSVNAGCDIDEILIDGRKAEYVKRVVSHKEYFLIAVEYGVHEVILK